MCVRVDLVKVPCKTGNIMSHFLHQRNQDLPKTVCHDKLELRMISGEMSWMPILWRNASCWLHRQCLRCVPLIKCGNCQVFHHNLMTPLLHVNSFYSYVSFFLTSVFILTSWGVGVLCRLLFLVLYAEIATLGHIYFCVFIVSLFLPLIFVHVKSKGKGKAPCRESAWRTGVKSTCIWILKPQLPSI